MTIVKLNDGHYVDAERIIEIKRARFYTNSNENDTTPVNRRRSYTLVFDAQYDRTNRTTAVSEEELNILLDALKRKGYYS